MSITVHTQAELDQALADNADIIYIESTPGVWLILTDSGSSSVVAWGSSSVEAWGSSSVEARDSSSVVARDSSSVVAWGSSSVEARDSSSVVARDSSSVEAWGSSSVEAWGSSSVVAWGSSSVVARGSSSVVARDSSSVEAGKYVGVHLWSQRVTLTGDGHVIDLTAIDFDDPVQWCEFHGVHVEDGIAYLFKAVDRQWTTGRGVDYSPGSTPEAPDWDASWRECGRGLHLCAHPVQSLAFLGGSADDARFLKVGVRLDEMVTLDDKVKVKRVVVGCVEVDRYGRVIEVTA